MTKIFPFTLIVAFTFTIAAAQNSSTPEKGLKDYYKNVFTMGVAVSPQALRGPEAELIKKHFASMTPENSMKMGPIHPEENRYNWKDADEIVDFAVKNNLKLRGHALCWHEQTPAWFFKDQNGNTVSKDVLLARLKSHITEVVTRYKGKVYAWDVVNEAVADDSTKFLRESEFYKICGEEFIAKAFEYAHAADPNAILFYNDYNSERPNKRDRICKLVKSLKDNGVPIHGVGLQGHWSIYEPSEKELRDALNKYSALGVAIQITELDMSIYPWEKFQREKKPGESDAFTPELEQRQLEQYKKVFSILREYRNVVTGVTFWNISDRYTWLDYYPVPGRKNYPLLFDRDLKPKKAFWEVVKF
jgi:endo-1,4-beta-xylanase